MKYRCVLASIFTAAASCVSGPVRAECKITALALPVTMEGLSPLVSAKVNGKDARFLLDSGSGENGISARFALDRKMKPATVEQAGWRLGATAETKFTGVGGLTTAATYVSADQFVLAGSAMKDVPFVALDRLGVDGIVGQKLLGQFDVEYDFSHGAVKMLGPKGCKDANLAYWVKPGTAYSVMPMERDPDQTGTRGPIWINGAKMRAVFDTGSYATFITRRAADRAGVKVTDPGVEAAGETGGLDRDGIKTWTARFASLKIGDEEIRNGLLNIGDTPADDFDVLVGADFFMSHHVMASNSQQKIYFTYEGGQVFSAAPKTTVAPAQPAKDSSGK